MPKSHPDGRLRRQIWRDSAACSETGIDFFSTRPQEKHDAKNMCHRDCPVRRDCLSYALNSVQLVGVWGGVDEYEIRRVLSVDVNGERTERARKPRCPWCHGKDLHTAKSQRRVTCRTCELSWPYIR